MYIFIRDATGSMLIWDGGDGATGKRYGAGLKNGDVLKNVCGRYSNYYGIPELAPTAQWDVRTGGTTAPEEAVLPLDSADVCRFVRLQDVTVINGALTGENTLPVVDAFTISGGIIQGVPTTMDAIVMLNHDVLQLWVVNQEIYTGLDEIEMPSEDGKFIRDGQLLIRRGAQIFDAKGTKIR